MKLKTVIDYTVFQKYDGQWSEVYQPLRPNGKEEAIKLLERYKKSYPMYEYSLAKIETNMVLI